MMNVEFNCSCAAHTINLAVRNVRKEDNISIVFAKGCKIVSHFHHSVIVSQALAKKRTIKLTFTKVDPKRSYSMELRFAYD